MGEGKESEARRRWRVCERAPASREELRPSEEAIVFAFKASAFTI